MTREKKRSISSTTPRPVLYVAFGRTGTIQSGPRRCTVVTRVKVTRHQEDYDGTFNSPTLRLKIPYEGSGRNCPSEYPPIRYRNRKTEATEGLFRVHLASMRNRGGNRTLMKVKKGSRDQVKRPSLQPTGPAFSRFECVSSQ